MKIQKKEKGKIKSRHRFVSLFHVFWNFPGICKNSRLKSTGIWLPKYSTRITIWKPARLFSKWISAREENFAREISSLPASPQKKELLHRPTKDGNCAGEKENCKHDWNSFAGIVALRMTALQIPQHVVLNETVRMQCNFNLDKELLYSVKWYKDGHEFYRYVPRDVPTVQTFRVPGVNVNVSSTSNWEYINRSSSSCWKIGINRHRRSTVPDTQFHGDIGGTEQRESY